MTWLTQDGEEGVAAEGELDAATDTPPRAARGERRGWRRWRDQELAIARPAGKQPTKVKVAPWSPDLAPLPFDRGRGGASSGQLELRCADGQLRLPGLPPQPLCLPSSPLFRNGDLVQINSRVVRHVRSHASVPREVASSDAPPRRALPADFATQILAGLREEVGERILLGPNRSVAFRNPPEDHLSRKLLEAGRQF